MLTHVYIIDKTEQRGRMKSIDPGERREQLGLDSVLTELGAGFVSNTADVNGTTIHYVYEAGIGGKVASIGGRLLDGAARVIIGQFFAALARQAGGGSSSAELSLFARLRQWFGGQR